MFVLVQLDWHTLVISLTVSLEIEIKSIKVHKVICDWGLYLFGKVTIQCALFAEIEVYASCYGPYICRIIYNGRIETT